MEENSGKANVLNKTEKPVRRRRSFTDLLRPKRQSSGLEVEANLSIED